MNVCPPVHWLVVPSQLIPKPEADIHILNNNKGKKSGDIVKEVKTHLQKERKWYLQFYTDRSKDTETGKEKKGHRISDQMLVFTADMLATIWDVGG